MSQIDRPVPQSQDALRYLGLIILILGNILQIRIGLRAFELVNDKEQLSYIMMIILGSLVLIGAILALFYNKLEKIKINIGVFTFASMGQVLVMLFLAPAGTTDEIELQIANGFAIVGLLFIMWALRPNFGPEANKRIYQASAGIFAFIVAIFILALGIWIGYVMNIADYAGNGTFPGDFYYSYIERLAGGEEVHELLRGAGTILIIAAVVIMSASTLRNRVGLEFASVIMFIGVVTSVYAIYQFADAWLAIDDLFLTATRDANSGLLPSEYNTQLRLKDPGIFTIGMVLVGLEIVGVFLMIYASKVAKPIEKWRIRRNIKIASAEVAIREGRLLKAVKDLNEAVKWSIKIGEEDRAIEMMTRIKQIEDKTTEMRKAKGIEAKKKELDKEKMADKKKQMKQATSKQQVREEMKKEEEDKTKKKPAPDGAKKIE